MRRVLIVTSSYAPTMIADMQRARQLAWELPEFGWDVEVLAPSAAHQPQSCLDEDSAGFFPQHVPVHFVQEVFRNGFKIAKIGSIGWRALLPLWSAGKRLLRERHFDLVYISTAHFPLYLLGPIWRRQCAVPFVFDLHDPLYKAGSSHPVWAEARLKHRLSNALAKHLEAHVATMARGVIAVSPNYIATLRQRYESRQPAWLQAGRCDAIPFSALPRDLCEAARGIANENAESAPPCRIVYVGVGGPVMMKAFTLFSRGLATLRARDPELCSAIRIDLFGTMLGWQPGDARVLADIATRWGIGDLVREEPGRVTYRSSMELLLQSNGALILGVEDAGYMPSKLFSYALSGKPLLAILHSKGPAFAQFERMPNLGHALWFDENREMPAEDSSSVLEQFLREVITRQTFDRRESLASHLAPVMTRRHVDLFEACL